MTYKILTFNSISLQGLKRFPRASYEVASEIGHPDAIMLRSHQLALDEIPDTVHAVGRAGVGVNNIPVDALSKRGVPVFNAPGANANAVKEMVVAAMFLAARNICPAWDFVRNLSDDELATEVERGKKKFAGFELPGRTLGVVGLGAIGVEVSNTALTLGMKVIGYDPKITVKRAWQLSAGVTEASGLNDVFRTSDLVSLHVPLVDETRGLVNRDRLRIMPNGSTLLNFSRGAIVDETAVIGALDEGHLHAYICDFPTPALKGHPKVTALPHLGASTSEAEDNCAVMVAENVKAYLEHGNIRHSVNFPEAIMPRDEGIRITIANANVPNMVGQISTALAKANLNIIDMLNKSLGDLAYTLVDVDHAIPKETVQEIAGVDGVLNVRVLSSD